MSWIPSRANFDVKQDQILNDIIDDTEQSWWLQGYAGTGKTMLLIHLIAEYVDAGWDCAFVTFTHALKKLAIEAMRELGHKPGQLQIETVDKLNTLKRRYDIIFVDEVQDLTNKQISKLLELGDRFVYAGDINQSIYLQAASSSTIKRALGKPKIVELSDLYRMPEPMFLAANITYPEAQIARGAQVAMNDSSSINLVAADSVTSEVEWVYKRALAESRNQLPSAILFGKHEDLQKFVKTLIAQMDLPEAPEVMGHDYDPLNDYLQRKRIKMMYFGGAQGGELSDASTTKVVLLMTMHSAKGLEFGSVFTPFMNEGYSLCPYPSMKNNDEWQRRFLFMAITRTKLNFYASYSKSLNEYLVPLAPENVSDALLNNDQEQKAEFFHHFHIDS
jgi:superfamily I DNA/RNA helicase